MPKDLLDEHFEAMEKNHPFPDALECARLLCTMHDELFLSRVGESWNDDMAWYAVTHPVVEKVLTLHMPVYGDISQRTTNLLNDARDTRHILRGLRLSETAATVGPVWNRMMTVLRGGRPDSCVEFRTVTSPTSHPERKERRKHKEKK